MKIGMLWFDNDPNTGLAAKVGRAAAYYRTKYGRDVDLCLVHPCMMEDGIQQVGKVTVRASRLVLPGHFWVGIEEKV